MVRLHLPQPLSAGALIAPSLDQSRYLTQVMRLGSGDEVLAFNEAAGEWRCTLVQVAKKGVILQAEEQTRPPAPTADVHLLIAVVKKSALEFAIEKATELGVARIRLVLTSRTQPHHVRIDRLRAIAEESAEQTGRLDVPAIEEAAKLTSILDGFGPDRRLMFCDETGGPPALTSLPRAGPGSWAILIGPEGGFSPDERQELRSRPGAVPVSLGPRILRADTAAAAALTLWQATLGDWER